MPPISTSRPQASRSPDENRADRDARAADHIADFTAP
jgi:hypothetical protein